MYPPGGKLKITPSSVCDRTCKIAKAGCPNKLIGINQALEWSNTFKTNCQQRGMNTKCGIIFAYLCARKTKNAPN